MSLDARVYRDIWGTFATGVMVVTTDCDGWLHGMTANGVTSVSLDPLLLLVCVAKSSRCHSQLTDAGKFGISLLAEDQEELSNLFAESADPEDGSLRGAAFHTGPNGTPLLDGCLAYLECEVKEVFAGGDHDIFLGEALDGKLVDTERAPLLFFRGGYRHLALLTPDQGQS